MYYHHLENKRKTNNISLKIIFFNVSNVNGQNNFFFLSWLKMYIYSNNYIYIYILFISLKIYMLGICSGNFFFLSLHVCFFISTIKGTSTSTPLHTSLNHSSFTPLYTSTPQHLYTPTPPHLSTFTPQHLSTPLPLHLSIPLYLSLALYTSHREREREREREVPLIVKNKNKNAIVKQICHQNS